MAKILFIAFFSQILYDLILCFNFFFFAKFTIFFIYVSALYKILYAFAASAFTVITLEISNEKSCMF